METLYHQTNKQLQEVQGELARLERVSADEVEGAESHIQAQIDHVLSSCERLDMLVMKEPPTRRANAKMKVSQLKYDVQHLTSALRQLQHKRQVQAAEAAEREALLSRSFTTNAAAHAAAVDMAEPALAHHAALRDSHTAVDALLAHGSSVISNLRSQRGVLKGAHKRLLDLGNTLGLSNTVMRLIEKRSGQDRLIMFVLMGVSLLLMYLVWKYFSGR